MKLALTFLALLISSLALSQTNQARLNAITNLNRIAFGSCNDQKDIQPLWKDMINQKPDLFIWGGDNVYADWKSFNSVEEAYRRQNLQPDYARLKSVTPIIGTWDDHDYSHDNANGTYKFKIDSQKYLLDFLEEPEFSPRRFQEGVYTSYEYGDQDKRIKIILLDNRYFKDLDPQASLLGKDQWAWLENELMTSTASINIIVSGLSITSPYIPYTEEWIEYTGEFNRMMKLLDTYKPKGVILLSGDKHFSSIFMRHGQLEFMSSGMTHTAPRKSWIYLGRKFQTSFFGKSYGLIDIAWEGLNPLITMSMRTSNGKSYHKYKFRWARDKWTWL